MAWNKTGFQCISIIDLVSEIPSDAIVYKNSEFEIRPGGLNIATQVAAHFIALGAVLYELTGDYGHYYWMLKLKWKDSFFEIYVYNVDDVMIRIKGPIDHPVYQDFVNALNEFLLSNTHFSDIKWSGEYKNKRFATPSKVKKDL